MSSILTSAIICESHEKVITHFCAKHNEIICGLCQIESHRKCKPMLTVEAACHNIKTGESMSDLETRLISLTNDAEKTCTSITSNLESQRQKAMEKMRATRNMLNAYLDKMEEDLDKELTDKFGIMKNGIENEEREIESRLETLRSWQKDIKVLTSEASNVPTFLAMKYVQAKVSKEEESLKEIQKRLMIPELIFTPSVTAKSLHQAIPMLGELVITEKKHPLMQSEKEENVRVKEKQKDIPKKVESEFFNEKNQPVIIRENKQDLQPMEKQGQFEIYKNMQTPVPINGRVKTLAFRFGNNVCLKRACFLPVNKLIMTDYENNALFLCTKEGEIEKRLELNFRPEDVCLLDQERAIVTGGDYMQIIDLPLFEPMSPVRLTFKPTFMQPSNGEVWVKEDNNHINLLKINGECKRTIETVCNLWDFCFSEDSNTLYWTTIGWTDYPAYCLRHVKEEELFFSEDPFSAWGITTDRRGNVYVADNNFHNIHRISKDGQGDIVLTLNDGIYEPECLKYNHETDELLVINRNGTDVSIYHMK